MRDEEPESVTLALTAGAGYTLSSTQPTNAQAMLASLRLKVKNLDDAPTGTVDVNDLINQLNDNDQAKRDEADRQLRGLLDQRPELEAELRAKADDEDTPPEIRTRLQSILASYSAAIVRLVSRGDFTIKLKLAKPIPVGATAKVKYSKADGPADFKVAGEDDLVAGDTALPDVKILGLTSGKGKVRVTLTVTDANGNETVTTQDIEIELVVRQAAPQA